MKWFEVKEQAAGDKRLLLTWWIYKNFGKKAVRFVAFFVALSAFIFAKDTRKYSKKYLRIININSGIINQFKHFLSYALMLIDRMEIFANRYNYKKISFASEEQKNSLYNDFKSQKGIFFICSHLGNIDAMRALLNQDKEKNINVNVFLSQSQCTTFDSFIKKISNQTNITIYPVEDIDINTSIELKERLEKGEIAFMAGDRVSQNNSNIILEANLFGKKIDLPKGTFKLAQLMEVPVYYAAAIKESQDRYIIHLEKVSEESLNNIKQICQNYANFLEKKVPLAPFQFYHFYDLFKN